LRNKIGDSRSQVARRSLEWATSVNELLHLQFALQRAFFHAYMTGSCHSRNVLGAVEEVVFVKA